MTRAPKRVVGPRLRTLAAATRVHWRPHRLPPQVVLAKLTEAIHSTSSPGGALPPAPEDGAGEPGVWHRVAAGPSETCINLAVVLPRGEAERIMAVVNGLSEKK